MTEIYCTDEVLEKLISVCRKSGVLEAEFRGLLNRLEAAERIVKAHPKLENETLSYDDFNSLVSQWRKAAGK